MTARAQGSDFVLQGRKTGVMHGDTAGLWLVVARIEASAQGLSVIAVDAGRNLAVLVEAAVRNTVLQLRGIDTYQEFIERHQRAMERGSID